jgi:hypothetical protein
VLTPFSVTAKMAHHASNRGRKSFAARPLPIRISSMPATTRVVVRIVMPVMKTNVVKYDPGESKTMSTILC